MKWMIQKRLQEGFSVEDKILMVSITQQIQAESLGMSCAFFSLTFKFLGSVKFKS